MSTTNLPKTIFANYNRNNSTIQITAFLETKKGVIPYTYESPDFIGLHPHIATQLINGKTLYIDFDCAYVGVEETEGPYCETQILKSEYEERNPFLDELLINLDDNIKRNKKRERKLIKIGVNYK